MKKKLLLFLSLSYAFAAVSPALAMDQDAKKAEKQPIQIEQKKDETENFLNPINLGYMAAGMAAKWLVGTTPIAMCGFAVSSSTLVDYVCESARVCHLQGIKCVLPFIIKKCAVDNSFNKLKEIVSIPAPAWIKNSKITKFLSEVVAKTGLSITYDFATSSLKKCAAMAFAKNPSQTPKDK